MLLKNISPDFFPSKTVSKVGFCTVLSCQILNRILHNPHLLQPFYFAFSPFLLQNIYYIIKLFNLTIQISGKLVQNVIHLSLEEERNSCVPL